MIKELIKKIKSNYDIYNYVGLSGDRGLLKIPEELRKLWYSDGNHSIAYCNIDYYYSLYKCGDISEDELTTMLTGLRDAFAHQFELINKANIKKGGISYEGFKPICKV